MPREVKEHFGNPTIEQRNLAAGTAAVDLGARGIITVTGPDRLEWLHSLLSQNLKNLLPGISAEALLLDPQGHIEHVIHFLDDGESSWLVVEAEGRESFLAWLNKMIFRMKVEVADRSSDFSVIGQIGAGIPQAYVSNGVALIWQDPWPGVVTGGVRYSMARPAKWQWTESLVEVNKVEAVLAEYEKAPLEAKASFDQIEEALFSDNPVAYCHVAEDNGVVVGISIWFLNYSTWVGKPGIYLEDLYVDPAFRGKGYGLAFLKELGKICVERDYERLQWWVLDWNQPSIDFYKSLGAVPMDEWTVYRVSGDALKKLAE